MMPYIAVVCLCICAPTRDQFLTFSFPSHADSERNGPESNHQVRLTPVIITVYLPPLSPSTKKDNRASQIVVQLVISIIDLICHFFFILPFKSL